MEPLDKKLVKVQTNTLEQMALIYLACIIKPRRRKWLESFLRATKGARKVLSKDLEYFQYFAIQIEEEPEDPNKGLSPFNPNIWKIKDINEIIDKWLDYCFSFYVEPPTIQKIRIVKKDLKKCWSLYAPLLDNWIIEYIEENKSLPEIIRYTLQSVCLMSKAKPQLMLGLPLILAQLSNQVHPNGLKEEYVTWLEQVIQSQGAPEIRRCFFLSLLDPFEKDEEFRSWINQTVNPAYGLVSYVTNQITRMLEKDEPQWGFMENLSVNYGFLGQITTIPINWLERKQPKIIRDYRQNIKNKKVNKEFDKRLAKLPEFLSRFFLFLLTEKANEIDFSKPLLIGQPTKKGGLKELFRIPLR
jgi:hypothetical protein